MTSRILTILLVTISASAGTPQAPSPWTPPDEPVYVVAPNNTVEGYEPSSTKFGDLLMVQIWPSVPAPSGGSRRVDGTRLYEKGKLAALFVDGQRQGEVRIDAVKEHHCDSAAALVVPTAAVSTKTVGLATNAGGIQSRPGSRRNPTAFERSSAVRLATQEFLRNNVAASLMTRINIKSLVAIEVDGSKEKTLVGSFFAQTKMERHDIFLIARVSGSRVSLEYSRYGETKDLEDFKDHRSIGLIDHLDLNRDRSDEIVLRVGGYESEGYEIYTRHLGKWQLVATGGEAGC